MKISTRSRYGVRALVDLALEGGTDPISLKVIAERQCLTTKYLERLFADLKRAGVVKGFRGATGGYILAQAPEEIRVGDVVRILEKNMIIDCIHAKGACDREKDCLTQKIWREIENTVHANLNHYTIADLTLH